MSFVCLNLYRIKTSHRDSSAWNNHRPRFHLLPGLERFHPGSPNISKEVSGDTSHTMPACWFQFNSCLRLHQVKLDIQSAPRPLLFLQMVVIGNRSTVRGQGHLPMKMWILLMEARVNVMFDSKSPLCTPVCRKAPADGLFSQQWCQFPLLSAPKPYRSTSSQM